MGGSVCLITQSKQGRPELPVWGEMLDSVNSVVEVTGTIMMLEFVSPNIFLHLSNKNVPLLWTVMAQMFLGITN